MGYLLDKEQLVAYMAHVHESEYGRPITRIKLQKGLYYLFAYWVSHYNKFKGTEVEDQMGGLSDRLFETNFAAWPYGPVDKEMYELHKADNIPIFNEEQSDEFIGGLNEHLSDYIYGMTRRIFNTSDFGLVDLSHEDDSWKKNYDESDRYHDRDIPEEDIINEYSR